MNLFQKISSTRNIFFLPSRSGRITPRLSSQLLNDPQYFSTLYTEREKFNLVDLQEHLAKHGNEIRRSNKVRNLFRQGIPNELRGTGNHLKM